MAKYTGIFILKRFFQCLITPDHPASAYLTGLRAHAALFVFLIHCNGGGLKSLHPVFENLISQGQHGVIIFFVLSGYVIASSILKAGDKFNLADYWQRRALRILPLYYFLLVLTWAFQFGNPFWREVFATPHDFKSVLLHFVFYGLYDQRYIMNGLGIDWTIVIEFTFYLLLPLWVLSFSNKKNWLIAFAVTFGFYQLSIHAPNFLPYETPEFPHDNMMLLKQHWSPYHYIPYFFAPSLLAYFVTKYKVDPDKYKLSWLVPLVIVMFIGNVMKPIQHQEILYGVMTLMVLVGCLGQSMFRSKLFENPAAILLGKISFSFYLLHYMVLQELHVSTNETVQAISAFILTLILSIITYSLIEKPFLGLKKSYKTTV